MNNDNGRRGGEFSERGADERQNGRGRSGGRWEGRLDFERGRPTGDSDRKEAGGAEAPRRGGAGSPVSSRGNGAPAERRFAGDQPRSTGGRGAGARDSRERPSSRYDAGDSRRREAREPSPRVVQNDPDGLQAGTVVRLEVAREVPPNGYFLSDGLQDVLLPYSEAKGSLKQGDSVEAFLFHDTYDRLMATMRQPLIKLGELAQLEVVDIHPRLGVFLEMGLGRNLLLPIRELPEIRDYRPALGDRVFVTMHHDKSGRVIARTAREEELAARCVRAPEDWRNRWVDATVYKALQMGAFVVCDAGPLGFGVIGLIPAPERTKPLRLGERVNARVAFVREEDGRVNLSMRQRKEVGRVEDSDKILQFMKERPNGAMPYSDQTPADLIMSKFGISKSAFKRALGKLIKEGLVEQKENWTYLRKPDQQ